MSISPLPWKAFPKASTVVDSERRTVVTGVSSYNDFDTDQANVKHLVACVNFIGNYEIDKLGELQSLESVLDNLEGIEDERNVYLAYFDAMGINPAEATRIGRDEMRIKSQSPEKTVLGSVLDVNSQEWADYLAYVDSLPDDPNDA